MDRRSFIKLTAITGTSATLASCGNPENELIRFIPDESIVPGVAVWKPGVCPLCPAGCGLTVRVMEADADVVRDGQAGVVRIAAAKKLEGAPDHPVNHGGLCPRGQAALQVTYHPDRITQPLRRTGKRGEGRYEAVSWEDALAEIVARLDALEGAGNQRALTYLTRGGRSHRAALIGQFLARFGAPGPVIHELFGDDLLRRANGLSFGREQLPTFDLASARYVISFGADFLGTWNSPVAQSAGYGLMRQGRPGIRGAFAQVESRMSQTGASADEWVPIRPGTDGVLALGIAHLVMAAGLFPAAAAGRAGALIDGWDSGLASYAPEEVERITGVAADSVERLARQFGDTRPAVAIVGGPPLAHSNGLFTALAVNALNALVGATEQPGGVFFTPQLDVAAATQVAGPVPPAAATIEQLAAEGLSGGASPEVLLVDGANPVFTTPPAWRVRELLEQVPYIVSFGSFLDETSILADLILPDHSSLESWTEALPESGAMVAVASVAPPVMRPLHQTRATPDVLLEIGRSLQRPLELPWQTFDELLGASFAALPPDSRWHRRLDGRPGEWRLVGHAAGRPGGCRDGCRVARTRPRRVYGTAVRRRGGAVSISLPAVLFQRLPRWLAGAPAVAAGNARPAHIGDVEQLGGDQPGHGGTARHRRGRCCGSRVGARHAAHGSRDLAGHRPGSHCHAGGAGASHLYSICERAGRKPC